MYKWRIDIVLRNGHEFMRKNQKCGLKLIRI